MNDRDQQLGTADIGLLIFVLVVGWLILSQSNLF